MQIVWDEAWSPDRLSETARGKLRFLPAPNEATDPAEYVTHAQGGISMIGDAFVFDGVAHPFNFEADNAYGTAGQMFSNHLYAFHATLTPEGEHVMPAEEFLHKWSIEEIHEMVYANSGTDMLVAMPLPLTDLYKDGLSPWQECARLAQLDPDRTVLWGTVNPLAGKKALDDVTRQVEEFGARAFKFYNVRYEDAGPVPWRMDDRAVAFPVFERIQELGINLVGVHKGVPLGPQPIEHTQTWGDVTSTVATLGRAR